MGTWTPWGTADHVDKVARGVVFYGTPSHGGYHLSPKMDAKVPAAFRACCQRPGWYEEDCEYVFVQLAFPELFRGKSFSSSEEDLKRTVKAWYPWAYEAHYGEEVKPEESGAKRRLLAGEAYEKASYERWACRFSREA